MPLTIREIGIVPSVERFVSTNHLLRHSVVLAILVVIALSASIVAYILAIHYGRPTQFSSSDPRVGFKADAGGRDTMDIISSCASTLITCVYSSVHFDVPRSYAHRLPLFPKLASRDFWLELWVKISFWLLGLFCPEMLVLHAFYEHMIARRDVAWMHEHGYPDWTLTLSFAADMGALTSPDGVPMRSGYALYDAVLRSRDPGALDCKALEYELADHTKADVLFKLITTLQIVRFFVGTVARLVLKLPVAPLETITCAYVICTLLYYGLWFAKPYGINERIAVRVAPRLRRARPIQDPTPESTTPEPKPKKTWTRPFQLFWDKVCVPVLEPEMTEDDRLHGSEHMWQSSPYLTQGSFIAAAASLMVGLAHLACWSVEFPNTSGQILWRYCSIAVIVLPILVAAIILGAAIILRNWVTEVMNKMALTMIVLYCIGRLVLLILLGHSFQSLPAAVYDTKDIPWLSFIPFIH